MESGMICTEFEGISLNVETFPKGDEEVAEEKKGGSKKIPEEFTITYDNLIKKPASIIPRISRTPQVDPPLYHQLEFKQLSTADKMKVLSIYHKRLSTARIKLAKTSMIHASFSEPIYPKKQYCISRSPSPEKVLEG